MIPADQPRRDNFRLYEPPMSRRDLALVTPLEICNDCGTETDPNDAAPSCGSHVLCVSCFETSDFHCRECHRVWDETTKGEEWWTS